MMPFFLCDRSFEALMTLVVSIFCFGDLFHRDDESSERGGVLQVAHSFNDHLLNSAGKTVCNTGRFFMCKTAK